jgi:hypothetical protein
MTRSDNTSMGRGLERSYEAVCEGRLIPEFAPPSDEGQHAKVEDGLSRFSVGFAPLPFVKWQSSATPA